MAVSNSPWQSGVTDKFPEDWKRGKTDPGSLVLSWSICLWASWR